MEKLLGQAAIDALFASVMAEGEETAAAPEETVQAFNFSRVGQIAVDQLRAIETVTDVFARNLMHTFGAWLRTEFNVAMVSREQMGYGEFVERLPARTFISSLRLEPLGSPALIEIEQVLVSRIIDLLLGGAGLAEIEVQRPLTDIEEVIMVSVVEMILKELNLAWKPVGLHFEFEKRESTSQVARLMSSGERTLCMSFEVKMRDVSGTVNLCLPAVVLNTILRKLVLEQGRRRARSPETTERVRQLVAESTVGAVLQFPPFRLRARELAAMQPETVLRLPIPRHIAAELKVGGLSFSKARPIRIGEHRGASMEEAPPAAAAENVH